MIRAFAAFERVVSRIRSALRCMRVLEQVLSPHRVGEKESDDRRARVELPACASDERAWKVLRTARPRMSSTLHRVEHHVRTLRARFVCRAGDVRAARSNALWQHRGARASAAGILCPERDALRRRTNPPAWVPEDGDRAAVIRHDWISGARDLQYGDGSARSARRRVLDRHRAGDGSDRCELRGKLAPEVLRERRAV